MPRPKQKSAAWWIESRRAVARTQEALRMRERAEQRQRYQSDLLQFWRRCPDARCRRKRTCKGDPDGCLGRGLAAMPAQEWLRGAIMATVKGAGTMEELVHRTGEEIAATRRAKPMDIQQLAARLKTHLLAEPAGASALPQGDEQADGEARLVVSERQSPASPGTEADTVEWSPMTGSSVDPVRAAALPPPADAPSARAGPASPNPASPGPADVPAAPPQPARPPGVEPWQAWCDDEGRLHMPDPAAVRERFRMLTRDEIQQRMRAYGG